MRKTKMLGSQTLKEFGQIMGLRLTGYINTDDGSVASASQGDRALFLSGLARIRCIPLEEQWKETPEDLGWYEVDRVHRGLEKFKQTRGLYDFTDLLERFIEECEAPELDLLVVDEAQDLSQLQWRMVLKLAKKARRVLVAGDDDQAIFQWAGADVPFFINLNGNVTQLKKSFRVPSTIQSKALSIINKISSRRPKTWASREDTGSVFYHNTPDDIDMGAGSWLVLARNLYLLEEAEAKCRREGLIYVRSGRKSVSDKTLQAIRNWELLRNGGEVTAQAATDFLRWVPRTVSNLPKEGRITMEALHRDWGVRTKDIWHEAFRKMSLVERSYMIAALRRGEKLTKQPRIILSTIHGAKGGEADNVILLSDVAHRTYKEIMKTPDTERRVLYVGLTRARNNLHIVVPKTKFSFPDL